MEQRKLGRTGEDVSVFGFGGLMLRNTRQEEANRIVAEAVDRGINFFDVGPTYGNSQERLGPALKPYRNEVILACKTEPDLTKEEVARDIRNSLRILQTDYFDIFQLHEVNDTEDIKKALGSGGALEAIIEAREQGLVRYIGFSSHFQQSALQLLEKYDFDTVLFPINWNYWLNTGAGKAIVDIAKKRNLGMMAIKALAHRKWKSDKEKIFPNTWYKPIYDDQELASLALRFTLSKQVSVAVSPSDVRMLRIGLDIIEQIDELALNEEEITLLKERAREIKPIFSHSG